MTNEKQVEAEYMHGLRSALRNNLFAYGYSLTATGSLAVLTTQEGAPTVAEVLLFIAGAVSAFAAAEIVVSRELNLIQERGESPDVVALGAAFGYLSAGSAVAMAALTTVVLSGTIAWAVAPLMASAVYVLLNGIELAVAEHVKKRRQS